MGKRGPKPREIIGTTWSANLAYAVGLLATDGCLYNTGRHIELTSKDREQIENFFKAIGTPYKITQKQSGFDGALSFRTQIGNVCFYTFLLSIGLTPAKSKTIGSLAIPKEYLFDFLRGSFDGDGCFYSYFDKRWRSSHMMYLQFSSASLIHLKWIRTELSEQLKVSGHISTSSNSRSIYNLRFAKKEALEIIRKMYYSPSVICLSRKRIKIEKAVQIETQHSIDKPAQVL